MKKLLILISSGLLAIGGISSLAFSEELELVSEVPLILNDTRSNKDAAVAAEVNEAQVPQVTFRLAPPPQLSAKAYLLIDANTGEVMAAKNATEQFFPASLTKILTLYIVASQLKHGHIALTDRATVSKRAWQTGGSRMFLQAGSSVSIEDLVKGVAVTSGNDATVALAEHLGGSEESFVEIMNQTAQKLQMTSSRFTDCNGLHDASLSTAADLAKLTSAWIRHFPEYYGWFKEKWFSYNNIRQPNRNRLLWRDEAVDGVKTGFTTRAGYCLIASARHEDTRLIAVVLGANSEAERLAFAQKLLNYGFRNYTSKRLFAAQQEVTKAEAVLTAQHQVALGLNSDLYISAVKDKIDNVSAKVILKHRYWKAPIAKGEVGGVLVISQLNKEPKHYPLVALEEVPRRFWLWNLWDYLKLLWDQLPFKL